MDFCFSYLSLFKKSVCVVGLWVFASMAHAQELPWHLGSLDPTVANAPAAINTANVKPGSTDVIVAVIDSGVLSDHPALKGRLLPGYDMVSGSRNLRGGRSLDSTPDAREAKCGERVSSSAYRTHGTEVASLIAGNGVDGVRGVNPNAKIVPVRLFGACQIARADLLDALAWSAGLPVAGVPANPNPANVINLSFSGGKMVCGSDLQALIDKISRKGVFVVAAVGNTFGRRLAEPANCEGVISVGAIDAENNVESYSALDPKTVIYAPGGGRKLSGNAPWHQNKLKVASFDVSFTGGEMPVSDMRGMGTSYAAPLVSGFIALLLSNQPNLTPTEFLTHLDRYSRAIKPTDLCSECVPRGLALQP